MEGEGEGFVTAKSVSSLGMCVHCAEGELELVPKGKGAQEAATRVVHASQEHVVAEVPRS